MRGLATVVLLRNALPCPCAQRVRCTHWETRWGIRREPPRDNVRPSLAPRRDSALPVGHSMPCNKLPTVHRVCICPRRQASSCGSVSSHRSKKNRTARRTEKQTITWFGANNSEMDGKERTQSDGIQGGIAPSRRVPREGRKLGHIRHRRKQRQARTASINTPFQTPPRTTRSPYRRAQSRPGGAAIWCDCRPPPQRPWLSPHRPARSGALRAETRSTQTPGG